MTARTRRSARAVALDGAAQLTLVGALLGAYLVLRVVVEGSPAEARAHADQILTLESRLGIDIERDLQEWVVGSDVLTRMANATYYSLYWPTVALGLGFLWWFDRRSYLRLRDGLAVAAAIGVVIFAVYPLSPPRFVPGFIDTLAMHGWRESDPGAASVNSYAAMPSFHVGWPALVAVAVARTDVSATVKRAFTVPPILIAVSVVATGNHYVLDVAVGVAVVVVADHCVRLRTETGSAPTGSDRRRSSTARPTAIVGSRTSGPGMYRSQPGGERLPVREALVTDGERHDPVDDPLRSAADLDGIDQVTTAGGEP